MKKLLVALLIVCAARASAQTRPFTLTAGESLAIEMFGLTAAYAIDASVLAASAAPGQLLLLARASGRTKLIVVSATGQHTYEVIVEPRAGTLAAGGAAKRASDRATAEVRYSTAARELQNTVTVARESKTQRTEAHLRTVHQADPAGERAKTSIASASFRMFRRDRELTLLDRDVDHSPLTMTTTPLRGIHYLDDHWRLHAGYTAYAVYRSFLIPIERELVAGGGYRFRTGARSNVTPTLFAIRGEGTIASLLYDYADGERLAVRGEVGYSGGFGAAGELAFDDGNDRVRAAFRYRPDGFASIGTTPHGFFSDASWTREYGRGSSFAASASATDIAGARIVAASADLEHRATDVVTVLGGASWATFDGRRTIAVPAGVRLDFAHGGVSALYRYSLSDTNRGGHGFRLAARASLGRLYASAYADRQHNAPTLELIFSERPDLALALAELGISATSPADIARALREHAALGELGFIEGVTVDLAPTRTQLGLEMSWLSSSASRQQLRTRLLHNVSETVASRRTNTIASISYSRGVSASTDVFASWSWWRSQTRGQEARVQPVAEIGIRQRFDGLPAIFARSGTITGIVFMDDDLDGVSDGAVAGAELELDGVRTLRTKADGTFKFTGVTSGAHRVVARVPSAPEAYFTTPSRVEAERGDEIVFGVAKTPARLFGRIANDAGDGIAGVRVLLVRGAQRVLATTASDGTYSIAAPPGEWALSILTDSVPSGHSLAQTESRSILLERVEPVRTEHMLQAHRSINGRTTPFADVEVRPLGRKVRADAQGQFAVRQLPAGLVTLVAAGVERRVDVPRGPASLDVEFGEAAGFSPPRHSAPGSLAPGGPELAASPAVFVNLGVFRVASNASNTATRARAAGVDVSLAQNGPLTIVRAGPFESRNTAAAAAARLTHAGLEAVVASRK